MAIFGKSKNFKQEYCCSIIKVDNITLIPDSDFLGIVNVAGFSIVVRKDQVHVGDIVFYASNETQLAEQQAKLNGVKTIGLKFNKEESDRFVLDWYLRSGYKPFNKKSNLLIKKLED